MSQPTAAATAEARLAELETRLAKFRHWVRDRLDRHRAALAAAPNPDHPSMDHDRHCLGELHRVAAELVWGELVPAGWLLPAGREAAAFGHLFRRGREHAVTASTVNPDAEFISDICHGREVPGAS